MKLSQFAELCGCSKKILSVEDATWVAHGIPYCNPTCMALGIRRQEAKLRHRKEMEARETAARAIAMGFNGA